MGWLWWCWLACVPPWPGDMLVLDPTLGFVHPGAQNTPSPSSAHHAGMSYAKNQLDGLGSGFRFEVVPYDAEGAFDELMEGSSNVFFTTRDDFASVTQQQATDHSDRLYFNCGGRVTGPNLSSYDARMYQAIYLAGRLGAHVSCTGRLAVVAPVATPEIIRDINAFTLGARKVNTEALVEVRFVGGWSVPEAEDDAVDAMVGHGADVVLHLTDGTATIGAAVGLEADCEGLPTPVRTIAYGDKEQCADFQDNCLTTVWGNWGPLYVDLLTQVMEGTLNPRKVRVEGFDRDHGRSLLQLTEPPAGLVDEEFWQGVLSEWDELAVQEATPFEGPLQDSDGLTRLAEGAAITDDELEEMCWFVGGVTNGYNGVGPADVPDGCVGEY